MKRDKLYLTFSLVAASALLTTKAKKELKQKKFDKKVREQIKETKKVLILGDSVARGYGTEIGGITKSLQEKLGIHFEELKIENLGVDGLTSSGLLKKVKQKTWQEKIKTADLIIINVGGNDLLGTFRKGGAKGVLKTFSQIRTQFNKNVKEIVKEIKQQNPEIIIFMNELYDSMDKKNQYYGLSSLMIRYWNTASTNEHIIKVKTSVMSRKKGYWIDLVHPNEEGYEEMGTLVFEQIHKYLK